MSDKLRILSGNANRDLAAEVCQILEHPLSPTKIRTFADGEIKPQIQENVRGCDVFVIQPTCYPANNNVMELLLLIDALKRASAERITAVIPYYGYARQDRKDEPRVPISARLVANLVETAGADRVLAMDLHAAQIGGFFQIPVDHLLAAPVFEQHYLRNPIEHLTVVSPDAGGVSRARDLAQRLGAPLAIIDKRRQQANVAEVMHIIGDVTGRNCLMIDDLVDTAGTLVKGSDACMKAGALSVRACSTHAVLSPPAVERITESSLTEVIFADTIPLRKDAHLCKKIKVLSIAPLLAQAIQSIHTEASISALFQRAAAEAK